MSNTTRKQKDQASKRRKSWHFRIKEQMHDGNEARDKIIRAYNLKTFGVEVLVTPEQRWAYIKRRKRKIPIKTIGKCLHQFDQEHL